MKNLQNISQSKRMRGSESGVALVITLLLVLLLTAMSVAMVLAFSSDMLINGYYGNYRGSFYAADSGLAIARQEIQNRLNAAIPASFGPTTQPIPTGTESTVEQYIKTTYGNSYHAVTGSGTATSSWPARFKITAVKVTAGSCEVIGGSGTCASPTGAVTGYKYNYTYSLTAEGQSQAAGKTTLKEDGVLTVSASLQPAAPTQVSFSGWGMFIDDFDICNGGLVPGTMTGPVFTNGAWTFGDKGQYIFTDPVGSASAVAGYQYSDGTCHKVAANSDSYKKGNKTSTIAPGFQGGLNLGQSKVQLPDNDFNQQRAVLDGMGNSDVAVSNSERHDKLRNASNTQYPSSGASSGVWLPYEVNGAGQKIFKGGGILVEGDAGVTLTPVGDYGQKYTIKQGTTTTTVVIDPNANTTTVSVNGGTATTISGVPMQKDPATGDPLNPATMLYVDGNITSLSGPGSEQPAIQDHTALTITAAQNVTITGDVMYKTEPVTLTQNQIPNTPAGTLIPGNDKGQALGIFTNKGNVEFKSNGGDIQVDASLATISDKGTGGLTVNGSLNTLTIVGGRIHNNIYSASVGTRNVLFDRRFGKNGFAPPWFPSTTLSPGAMKSTDPVFAFQRLLWQNLTVSAY